MASTAPLAPTPKITAKKSASSSPGKATAMFTTAVTSRPARRPTSTDAVPSSRPTTTVMDVASSASSIDSRLATSTR